MRGFRKIISFIATIATLLNSLGAPLTVIAQEITPEPTPVPTEEPLTTPTTEPTITPTEEPTITPESTPTEVAIPTPEATVEPTPVATDLVSPAPDASQPETQNTTSENTQSQAPPSESPTVTPSATPEVPQEHGDLTITTIEEVDLSQVTQLNANVDGNSNITTDKADYHPTDVVLISGTGFTPHKAYTLEIISTDEPPVDFEDQIKADESGNFTYAYQLDGNYRPNYAIYVRTGDNIVASTTFTDGPPSKADLDQYANDPPVEWVNGNLGASKATYYEGDSIPYRMKFDNIDTTASHVVTIEWDTTKSGKHAEDYLTSFDRTVNTADPCVGVSGCSSFTTYPIPLDPQVSGAGVTQIPGVFTMYGGTITAASAYTYANGSGFTGDKSARITLTFTSTVVTPVLAWGGHIATRTDWGSTNSAISISGSPYHMRLIDVDGGGGNQDRSLSADAVIFPGTITVVKNAVPDDAQDFVFTNSGLSPISFSLDDDTNTTLLNSQQFSVTDFPSTGGQGNEQNGSVQKTVTEGLVSGWALTNLACTEDGAQDSTTSLVTGTATINVQEGEYITCTFTNTLQQAHLTLVKTVTNNNGGTALATAWTLAATGPTNISGTTGSGSVTNAAVNQGAYTLSESSGPSGYTPGSWSCIKNGGQPATGNSITLAPNDNATCTIDNNDNAPSLTLDKIVVNDNGGTQVESAWTLTATGPTTISGSGAVGSTDVTSGPGFSTGTYALSESGPSGYSASNWICSGGTQVGSNITVGLGQSATCTITNDDNEPQLHLRKTTTNDNGGTAVVTDWNLTATGALQNSTNLSGSTPVDSTTGFKADTYTLGETGTSGYAAGAWDCGQATMPDATHVTVPLGANITCTINNDDVAPKLHLRKVITNDNGGTATEANFTLTADGTGANDLSGTSPVDSGAGLKADTFALSETNPGGYSASAWVCSGGSQNGSNITLGLNEEATCTITNDDIAPSLTLIKEVSNNDGGNNLASEWTLTATGTVLTPTNLSGTTPVVSGTGFKADTYTLGENGGPSGYIAGTYSCVKNNGAPVVGNSISLALGDSATCTIVNDDIPATITLNKVVINTFGGTAVAGSFTLLVDGSGVTQGVANNVVSNIGHTINENQLAGYEFVSITGDALCPLVLGGSVTLNEGQNITCTITNHDVAAHLIVIKHVINDNGGSKDAADFSTTISGVSTANPTAVGVESPGVDNTLTSVGSYSIDEGAHDGYTKTLSTDCTGTIALGQTKTCTITNDDISPTLKLVKNVTNDNGGTKVAADWTLSAAGTGGFSDLGNSTTFHSVNAGIAYSLSESNVAGYTAGSWNCDGGSLSNGAVTLGLNQNVTCSITNNDNPPSLTLIKQVTNDNGGTALPSAWTLTATGPSGFSGSGPSVSNGASFDAGTYNLSESGGPTDYTAGDWVCVGVTQDDGDTVTLGLGESATCTITNNDNEPQLHLRKTVTNDNGGTATATDWTLTATGTVQNPTNLSGSTPVDSTTGFKADTYALGETGTSGYTAGTWNCGQASMPDTTHVTVPLGANITCTVNNDDIAAHLIVIKHVINDDGGLKDAADFSTTISGVSTVNPTASGAESPGVDNILTTVGSYSVDEGAHDGYSKTLSADCTGTIALGQTKTCTITNDDIAPQLTVIKHVINDNGGSAVSGDFTMNVTATNPSDASFPGVDNSGTTITLNAGSYSVSETGPSGYSESDSQDCTGTIAVGENKTCTITNDDIAPILHLIKEVITDDGGDATVDDFTLTADGTDSNDLNGTSPVDSGATLLADTFTLSETNLPGYSASAWVCDGGSQEGSTLALDIGEEATCTITNDDIPAKITLIKVVINRGGEAGPNDFGISIDEKVVTSGSTNNVNSNTSHTIDEQGILGYQFVSITGDEGCPTELGGSVTLNEGEEITCTITNREILKSIKIEKSNNKSGGASAGDTVNYTLVVTNTGDVDIPNVVVTDILPGGFSYINNTAQVNGVPQNPGVSGSVLSWNVGTVTTENPVTITYQAKIASDVSDGIYTNFASCSETALPNIDALVLFQPAVCETVHSDVPIGRGVSFGGNLGQVLGISTELPATGSPTGLALIALGLVGVGFILKKKYVKN
jgi:uncharacterized repeat protein (TIGR01451 family)